jgi:hypothetical protein
MATMEEYLREMELRAARGWTPGVPSRFTAPVSGTWNLPTTARTTMRQALPRFNLGDIAAASADPTPAPRRGRPRTTPERLQSISDRAGTGTIKSIAPMLGAISKVAGPAAIAYDALRSEPAVASELAPGINPTDFRNTQAYPSMNVDDPTTPVTEVYPNISTLPSFDVVSDPVDEVVTQPTMGEFLDSLPATYNQAAEDWMDPAMINTGPPGVQPDLTQEVGYGNLVENFQPNWGTMENMYASLDPSPRVPFVNIPTEQARENVASVQAAAPTGSTNPQIQDIARHAGMMFDVPVDFSQLSGAPSRPSDTVPGGLGPFSDVAAAFKDTPLSVAIDPTTTNLQDVVNNTVFQDLRDSVRMDDLSKQQAFDVAIQSPDVVWDKDALSAASALIEDIPTQSYFGKTYGPRTDAINAMMPELTTQVDTFSSPLASPDITAQAMIDADVAAGMLDVNEFSQANALQDAVTNINNLVNEQQFVSANPISVLAKTGMLPAVANFDAGPAVQKVFDTIMPTAQAATPAGPSAADIQRDKQAAVDARNAERARQEAINAQMAQEAAARQRQQQQAVAAEQARQAQAAQAAQDRVRQARQIMNSRDYQEGGMGNLSAAQRDIVAAAQVDTFASGGDRSGEVREAMRSVGYGGPEWT